MVRLNFQGPQIVKCLQNWIRFLQPARSGEAIEAKGIMMHTQIKMTKKHDFEQQVARIS